MTTDINQQISHHFDNIYPSAREDAPLQASSYYERLQIPTLEVDEQLSIIIKELELLNKEIEDFEYKEYIHFAAHKENCFKIYSSRWLFYGHDEEAQLRKGCFLYERSVQLTQLYAKTELLLPPFTFSDFLCNKRSVTLYETGRKPFKTKIEDYLKILNWQTQKKVECVLMQAKKFKESFIKSVGANSVLKELIEAEMQQLQYIFDNAGQLTTQQFITELLKLRVLSVDAMPENEIEFQDLFCKYTAKVNMRSHLTPQFFESSLNNIKIGKITDAPICCWSFGQYDQWLSDVLKEKIDLNDVTEPPYDLLFEQSYFEGYNKGEMVIADFQSRYPSRAMPAEEYRTVILEELNKRRIRFNQLKDKDYYFLILDIEAVKNHFTNNCLRKNKIEIQREELKETVALYNMTMFLQEELFRIDKNPIENAIDQMELNSQITEIIAAMVPKTALINQLFKVLHTTLQQLLQRKIPPLFIARNLKDSLKSIYEQAEDHLELLFKNEPPSKRRAFVSYQFRDIQYKERAAQREGLDLHEYFSKFKELLSIESDYLKLQPGYNPIDIKDLLQEPKTNDLKSLEETSKNVNKKKSNKPVILAFKYDTTKEDKLYDVFQELNDLNVFSKDVTLPQFRKLTNGQEVNTPLRWLADQGDLMVFIKEVVKNKKLTCPYLQHWKIAIKCFVKADGSSFNAINLKASQPTILQSAFIKAANKF
jgi:hypothetical protein